jgi:kynurenine formamidase
MRPLPPSLGGQRKESERSDKASSRIEMMRFIELGHLLTDGEATSARFADDLGQIPLASFAGVPGIVVEAPIPPRMVAVDVDESAVQDKAVLIRTGWDRRWGTCRYKQAAPYLAPETTRALVHSGLIVLGVDFCTDESAVDPSRPSLAHLLRAGVLVIENLCNLSALPTNGFRFFAVPLGTTDRAPVPVRAFAELQPQ